MVDQAGLHIEQVFPEHGDHDRRGEDRKHQNGLGQTLPFEFPVQQQGEAQPEPDLKPETENQVLHRSPQGRPQLRVTVEQVEVVRQSGEAPGVLKGSQPHIVDRGDQHVADRDPGGAEQRQERRDKEKPAHESVRSRGQQQTIQGGERSEPEQDRRNGRSERKRRRRAEQSRHGGGGA